jgi:hypothetical protein
MGHLFSKAKRKRKQAANHEVVTPPDPDPETFGEREDASKVQVKNWAGTGGKMPSTKDFVDSTIKNNKVVIW